MRQLYKVFKSGFFLLFIFLLASCVGKKKYTELENQNGEVKLMIEEIGNELGDCNERVKELEGLLRERDQKISADNATLESKNQQLSLLQDQIDLLKSTNSNLLDRMAELNIVNQAGAESIKKSLESLDQQNKYINELTSKMQEKDSVMLNLVVNLKRSLADVNDEDISVEVRGGVVLISISDKLLFSSGSFNINARAEEVLGKVASVLKDHQDLDILVEGHTDNVPINTQCMKDNWDLSAKRATSVVRVLQNKYEVNPARMTAGGRSEYVPKDGNDTAAGRQENRRTEIVITPKLDQYFQLLTPQGK